VKSHFFCLQVLEMEANEAAGYNLEDDEIAIEPEEPQVSWHITFREQRQQIIELWDVCYVSIIHRTQFYLLFKGDPADQIYMEVELRRLSWLQQHLAELGNASPAPHVERRAYHLSRIKVFLLLAWTIQLFEITKKCNYFFFLLCKTFFSFLF
jgi:hypothetical protein